MSDVLASCIFQSWTWWFHLCYVHYFIILSCINGARNSPKFCECSFAHSLLKMALLEVYQSRVNFSYIWWLEVFFKKGAHYCGITSVLLWTCYYVINSMYYFDQRYTKLFWIQFCPDSPKNSSRNLLQWIFLTHVVKWYSSKIDGSIVPSTFILVFH